MAAAGPDGGARLTAAPGSGTEAGGTGGGRSLKSWASAGEATKASRKAPSAKTGHACAAHRHRKMPPPPILIPLLFTENAANSSRPQHPSNGQAARWEPPNRPGIGAYSRDQVIMGV